MNTPLMIIAVIFTIAVPILLAAALVRAFNHKTAKYLLHGALIMLVLAVTAFILSGMLAQLSS